MSSDRPGQRPVELSFFDATCGSSEGEALYALLDSVPGLSVNPASLTERKSPMLRTPSLALLVAPSLSEREQQQLLARISPREGSVIVAAIHPETESISRWMDAGVADYFSPPWDLASILPRIRKAIRTSASRDQAESPAKTKRALDQMIGQSAVFRQVVDGIPAIATCDAAVLITGETGTGKELCARAIHYVGPRCRQPFVPLNCGAIPPDLLENELFGHSAGAYTSAATRHDGIIAEAEGGTLFLDEVDSLPLVAQTKLLRFLQSKEYRPLGSAKTYTANVRLVAATNADPAAAVKSGRLRQDLSLSLGRDPTPPATTARAAHRYPIAGISLPGPLFEGIRQERLPPPRRGVDPPDVA